VIRSGGVRAASFFALTPVAPEALDHRLFFLDASGEGWRYAFTHASFQPSGKRERTKNTRRRGARRSSIRRCLIPHPCQDASLALIRSGGVRAATFIAMTPVAPEALDHRLFFLDASGEGWRYAFAHASFSGFQTFNLQTARISPTILTDRRRLAPGGL
jgi:hypothetical protein